ncbi:MAG: PstS family phosphate transporter substrate-binding protein, partial [Clostridiales bacterium]|nr:PstS family phosphate transporter substrate-binding protein [Clostridiales bacterium]
MVMNLKNIFVIAALAASLLVTTACGATAPQEATKKLSGEIKADGSSTVGPITQVAVEEFGNVQKSVKIPVGTSGTGGGMKKMATGDLDIANASRKIKDSELAAIKEKGLDIVEFKIAYDG